MGESKKDTVGGQIASDLLTAVRLKKKQSVRATFRLPEETIKLLSIVASLLGLKQKSLLDQLVEDEELLMKLAKGKIDGNEIESRERRPKTFVVSRNSLSILDSMAQQQNMPRDLLVEISIRRLIPILKSEHEKQVKRKCLHEDVDAFFTQGGGILRKAARLLDREDDYYKLLKRTIDVCKENARELKSIVNRGSAMDDLDFPE